MIRLIIYLVISIGVIIMLMNIPSESKIKKKQVPIDSEIREVISKDTLGNKLMLRIGFIDSISYYKYFIPPQSGIPVQLPGSDSKITEKSVMLYIDSNHVFYLENKIVKQDSLELELKKIFNQKGKRGKILLNLDKSVDSELTVFVLDLANKNKWIIGLSTKN